MIFFFFFFFLIGMILPCTFQGVVAVFITRGLFQCVAVLPPSFPGDVWRMDLFVDRLIKAHPDLLFYLERVRLPVKPGLVLGEHLAPVMNSCESSPGKHDPVAALLQPCGGTPVCGSHAFYFPWPRLFISAQAFKENQSQRVHKSYSIWTNLICWYKAINNCHKTTPSHLLGQKVHCTSLIDFRFFFSLFFSTMQAICSHYEHSSTFYFWTKHDQLWVKEGDETEIQRSSGRDQFDNRGKGSPIDFWFY